MKKSHLLLHWYVSLLECNCSMLQAIFHFKAIAMLKGEQKVSKRENFGKENKVKYSVISSWLGGTQLETPIKRAALDAWPYLKMVIAKVNPHHRAYCRSNMQITHSRALFLFILLLFLLYLSISTRSILVLLYHGTSKQHCCSKKWSYFWFCLCTSPKKKI